MSLKQYIAVLLVNLMLAACGPVEVSVSQMPAVSGAAVQKVVFLAGPDSHGPLAHEHNAGSKLLAHALREANPGIATVNVYGGWPEDETLFNDAGAVVIYCDGGGGHLINDHLETFDQLVSDGVGVVALHYAVEVSKGSASAETMLRATGGYFETGWSVNPHWEADFKTLPLHPITAGIAPFSMNDEWYFNMRFVAGLQGVTPILSAIAPAETMDRSDGPHSGNPAVRKMVAAGAPQVLAWAYDRPGGGRGFGYTGGHFHKNWQDDNARQLVLNAIQWVSKR